MTRAYSDMGSIERDITSDLKILTENIMPTIESMDAMCAIETFIAVALRVMTKTNPSKIKDAARTEEIKARIDGRPIVCRSAA